MTTCYHLLKKLFLEKYNLIIVKMDYGTYLNGHFQIDTHDLYKSTFDYPT